MKLMKLERGITRKLRRDLIKERLAQQRKDEHGNWVSLSQIAQHPDNVAATILIEREVERRKAEIRIQSGPPIPVESAFARTDRLNRLHSLAVRAAQALRKASIGKAGTK